MTDKEIYQQIEEYSEESNALYEQIHERVENSIVKYAQTKKRRKKILTGILSVATAIIVVLAIVLPIVLQPQDDEIRYSDTDVLIPDALGCNLKEYYLSHNLSLLYLDWYENAGDLHTFRYYEEGKENDTVYFNEKFTDNNTRYTIILSVMKRNVVVERLDSKAVEYKITNIGDTKISYVLTKKSSIAKFEYKGYKYYLEIDAGVTFEFLVQTIESMFNN